VTSQVLIALFGLSYIFSLGIANEQNREPNSATATIINLIFADRYTRMTTDSSGAASLFDRGFWFPIPHSPVEVSPFRNPGVRFPVPFIDQLSSLALFLLAASSFSLRKASRPAKPPGGLGLDAFLRLKNNRG